MKSLAYRWHRLGLATQDWWFATLGRMSWRDGDLVSFPIATFDRIDILVDRTLPSILSQTHHRIEVVVALDGTPPEMLSRLEEVTDPRVRFVRLARRTDYPSSPKERWMVAGWRPRNIASRRARGAWIYWISDDDVLMPNAVSKLLEIARRDSVEVVSGSYLSGTLTPVVHGPADGLDNFGVPISGPPVWMCRRYVGRFRWNRFSWHKQWNRPSDYDLIERMVKRRATFAGTDEVLAIQPDVEGSAHAGLRGALDIAAAEAPGQKQSPSRELRKYTNREAGRGESFRKKR